MTCNGISLPFHQTVSYHMQDREHLFTSMISRDSVTVFFRRCQHILWFCQYLKSNHSSMVIFIHWRCFIIYSFTYTQGAQSCLLYLPKQSQWPSLWKWAEFGPIDPFNSDLKKSTNVVLLTSSNLEYLTWFLEEVQHLTDSETNGHNLLNIS